MNFDEDSEILEEVTVKVIKFSISIISAYNSFIY